MITVTNVKQVLTNVKQVLTYKIFADVTVNANLSAIAAIGILQILSLLFSVMILGSGIIFFDFCDHVLPTILFVPYLDIFVGLRVFHEWTKGEPSGLFSRHVVGALSECSLANLMPTHSITNCYKGFSF